MLAMLLRPWRGRQTRSLTELPCDFLLRLFINIPSVRDLVALQSTCKRLHVLGRTSVVWTDRLKKEYDLEIKVRPEFHQE